MLPGLGDKSDRDNCVDSSAGFPDARESNSALGTLGGLRAGSHRPGPSDSVHAHSLPQSRSRTSLIAVLTWSKVKSMTRRQITGALLNAAQIAEVLDPSAVSQRARFGRLLDASGIDFVVLTPGPLDGVRLDASIAATVLARHTVSVGLVVAATPLRDHPYNLARRISSLDHLSGGRAGWLVLPTDPAAPAGSVWTDAAPRDVLVDAVHVARKLWESWPADSIIGDTDAGIFTDSERIVHIDHVGAHSVSGPLNVPEPPQGKIPIFWESQGGIDEIADVADVVLTATSGGLVFDGGVVVAHPASAVETIEAAAALVETGGEGVTLRRRLGLGDPRRVLVGTLRSAFPVTR